jgi:hypothetical protein
MENRFPAHASFLLRSAGEHMEELARSLPELSSRNYELLFLGQREGTLSGYRTALLSGDVGSSWREHQAAGAIAGGGHGRGGDAHRDGHERLNPFVHFDFDQARERARQAEQAVIWARSSARCTGPYRDEGSRLQARLAERPSARARPEGSRGRLLLRLG